MIDDSTLLRRYAAEHSDADFAEFVRRHLPLVYSAALRRLGGDAHRAQDVAQSVFCAVARDAHRLSRHTQLIGWLYTATRYAAIDAIRTDDRRRAREQEAHLIHEIHSDPTPTADWSRLRPVLDASMDELNEADREAVLLRFFQGRPFAEIGTTLGLSEDTARKRVERALDKLRGHLGRHRITSTSTALASLLAAQSVAAAPAGLAATITSTAVAATGSTAGFLTLLAAAKFKVGLAAAVGLVGFIGFATLRSTPAPAAPPPVAAPAIFVAAPALPTSVTSVATALVPPPLAAPPPAASARPSVPSSAPHTTTQLPASSPPPVSRATPAEHARLHRRYDPFLLRYGLTPAQRDRFVELKLAIATVQEDLQSATRQLGEPGGTPTVEISRANLTRPLWDEIYQLLGPAGRAAYGEFEQLSFYTAAYLEPLQPALAAAHAPLTAAQSEQLPPLFARHAHSARAQMTDIYTTTTMDWDAVLAEAGAILDPAQLAVLRQHAARRQPPATAPASAPRSHN